MKRGPSYSWIPLWIDKWLWGSTRLELDHAERAIFIDLLALAAKDNGFVRANETTAYPLEQLAGMLRASPELMRSAIQKCIQFGKITDKDGILFINNWQEYRLTPGYKRAVTASGKAESAFGKADTASPFMSMYYKNKSFNKDKFLEDVVVIWNEFAHKLALRNISGIKPDSTRERHLLARAQEKDFDFTELLKKIERQPFLLGENKQAWTITFDWIICPSNYTKIMEEQYPARAPRDDVARDRRVGASRRPASPEEKEAQERLRAEFQAEKEK